MIHMIVKNPFMFIFAPTKKKKKVMRKVQTKPHAGVEMFIFVR